MDTAELKERFIIELDAVASAAAPGFTDSEISNLLNKSQDEIIKTFVQLKDWNSIYTLLKHKYNITPASSSTEYNGKVYHVYIDTYVPDFRYYIDAIGTVTRISPESVTGKVKCELISKEDMFRFFSDLNNTPYFKNPKIVLESEESTAKRTIRIIVDSYSTLSKFEINYVKKPTPINIGSSITSELPEFLHTNLVTMAVQEAVKSLYISKPPQLKSE